MAPIPTKRCPNPNPWNLCIQALHGKGDFAELTYTDRNAQGLSVRQLLIAKTKTSQISIMYQFLMRQFPQHVMRWARCYLCVQETLGFYGVSGSSFYPSLETLFITPEMQAYVSGEEREGFIFTSLGCL